MQENQFKYTPNDFKSNQEVRWCAGCGDSAVLAAVQRTLAELDFPKEKFAFISGIGCSSRFPYYMNTYGVHGIHGRATAIASGTKVANRDLSVWVITGDGDSMAIGGNHFIHVIRRNVDLNILLLNNQIYGLTKGQYSPTSRYGQVTKTSPYGTVEPPFTPGNLTLGAQGNFFARTVDNNIQLMVDVFKASYYHRGTSIIEILQNCVIYNDGAYSAITDKEVKEDAQLILAHGKPMIFGKNKDKGIIFHKNRLKVVTIGENGITESDILVHDEQELDMTTHMQLINMELPDFPVALGVIRSVVAPTYSDKVIEQINDVKSKSKIKCMDDLLNTGNVLDL